MLLGEPSTRSLAQVLSVVVNATKLTDFATGYLRDRGQTPSNPLRILRSNFGVLAYGCTTFSNFVSKLLESQETPDSVSLRRALMGVRHSGFVDFSAALAILGIRLL